MATLIKKDGTQITVLKSNKDSKKYINPVFNFDLINSTHKEAIVEAIKIIESRKGVPQNFIVEELKQTFKLEDIPEMSTKDSLWYQFTKDEPIGASVQGYRTETDENGKKYKIPYVAFSADLDLLDDMIRRIIIQIKNTINIENKS